MTFKVGDVVKRNPAFFDYFWTNNVPASKRLNTWIVRSVQGKDIWLEGFHPVCVDYKFELAFTPKPLEGYM